MTLIEDDSFEVFKDIALLHLVSCVIGWLGQSFVPAWGFLLASLVALTVLTAIYAFWHLKTRYSQPYCYPGESPDPQVAYDWNMQVQIQGKTLKALIASVSIWTALLWVYGLRDTVTNQPILLLVAVTMLVPLVFLVIRSVLRLLLNSGSYSFTRRLQ